ncbi:MAG: sugar phosphate nucleotidyltransferase [Clostridium sp.]|nr:sugar phosphate nucleotidyltransferase [Clostridium sp.]
MLKKYKISLDNTVKSAIEKMENEFIKAVVIVDDDNRVIGLFSNGDMRRFFLKGGILSANISEAMNKTPKLYFSQDEIDEERKNFLRVVYPIVDEQMHLIDVVDYNQINSCEKVNDSLCDIPLVIMAGGKGTRLYPYTEILPKPLIPIGDKTITERIIHSFERYGCNDIVMILNYKSNIIKAYMKDIDKDYNIDFFQENKFQGTAGGLKLLRDRLKSTFFLTNCDVLIDADFECIYKTHKKQNNLITFVCSVRNIVIPYGVVETDSNGTVISLKEKPDFSFMINTGLYMIEPEVMDYIEQDEFIHLPDLAKRIMDSNGKVGVFPISEKSWMDMGQLGKLDEMKKNLGLKPDN